LDRSALLKGPPPSPLENLVVDPDRQLGQGAPYSEGTLNEFSTANLSASDGPKRRILG
jgi:hypothetical protein